MGSSSRGIRGCVTPKAYNRKVVINKINPIESDQFPTVAEWVYKTRRGSKGKVAIPEPISVYVDGDRVDALLVVR